MRSNLNAQDEATAPATNPSRDPSARPRVVFGKDSEYHASRSIHNGKNYAVIVSGLVSPLALFGYSDLAVEFRDHHFPGADVVEITGILPPLAALDATRASPGEREHGLLS